MSKSLGNDVPPEQIIEQSGAEILRLWVAMTDYREEIRVGKEILARVVEAYRKLRNTLRYLRGQPLRLRPGRGPACRSSSCWRSTATRSARFAAAAQRMRRGVRRVRVPAIVPGRQRARHRRPVRVLLRRVEGPDVHLRRGVDGPPVRRRRRCSCIADGLVRLIAPLLPVTADELWRALPGQRDDSVHLAEFPAGARRVGGPGAASTAGSA